MSKPASAFKGRNGLYPGEASFRSLAPSDGCINAAIVSLTEGKRTSRGHREYVASDPSTDVRVGHAKRFCLERAGWVLARLR
jgi:hypothetical protein